MSVKEYLQAEISMMKTMNHPGINGYQSTHDYVLQHGKQYESVALTAEELDIVCTRNFADFKTRQCYRNAQVLLLFMSNICNKVDIRYVEGVASADLIPVDHAWITLNGKVIDLTWGPMKKVAHKDRIYLRRTSRVLGVLPEGYEYLGIEFTEEQVMKYLIAHGMYSSLLDDYECRWPVLRGAEEHSRE